MQESKACTVLCMLSKEFINQQFKDKGKCLIWYEYYSLQVLEKFSPQDIQISCWVKNRKVESALLTLQALNIVHYNSRCLSRVSASHVDNE